MKVRVTGAMLRWTVSGLALITASLGASTSFAADADAAASNSGSVEEVTVTARKREESLKDVPLAISVVTQEGLKQNNIVSLEDLSKTTPGLAVATTGGTYQAPVIRGLAQIDQTSATGNVGVFIDGILLNNRSGQEFSFLDISRIEVVKGPQSASYGQNTFSGAINYVTKAPVLGKYDAYAAGDVGDYGYYSAQTSVNIPIGDNFALRVAGGKSQFNGTIPNVRDGTDLGGWKNHSSYSGSLLFTPTEDVRVKVYWERTDTYENQSPYAYLGGSVQANVNANNCGSVFVGTQGVPYKSLFCGTLPIPTSVNLLDQAPASGLVGFSDLGYASADWDLKFATLTGTFGFGNARFNQNNDTAGSASAISTPLFAGSPLSQQTFLTSVGTGSAENTYEIKLTSPSGQRLNWLVGLYNYSSYVNDETALFYSLLNNYNATQLSFFSGGDKKFSGNAIYGAIGFDVTSRLNLRAEGRQSADDYKITLPSAPSVKGHQVWNSFTPRFTATFKLTDEDNIYASAAKGFKIGGFNTSAFNTPQFTYAPETNWTYELGIKGTMLDRKLSFDTDVYYIDWTGIQVQSYIAALGGSVVVNNLGAISYGWEADTTYHFTPNLYIRASGTLLNPHYKSGTIDGEAYPYCDQPNEAGRISIGCTASVGGKQLSRTSNAQGDFAGQWTVPNVMNGYDAFVHADWSYQAGRHYLSVATNTEGDIELMNARIGLKHNNYEIDFWVKNALDYKYLERSTQTAAGAAYGAGVVATRLYPGNGRTLGGEISARW